MTAEDVQQATPAQPPRNAWGLLLDPVFGGLFWGKLLATAGVFVHSIVAAIVVFEATGSALMVGLVTVAMFAPQIVFAPLSGGWADRGHAVRQITLGRFFTLMGSGSLAVWTWAAGDVDGLAATLPVLITSLIVGLGFVLGGPAMNSIIPTLIRPGELTTAMALNSVPTTVARIGGPALGAFITAHSGPAAAFGFAAATHLIFLIIILAITIPVPPAHPPGVDYSVRAALVHVWHDRPLLLLLIGVTAVGFASEPAMTLAPALADDLGGGAGLVGQLSAAFGIGAAVGLALIAIAGPRVPSPILSSVGLLLTAIGLMGVPASPVTWVALTGFVVAGFGFAGAMTGVTTMIQERAPEQLRGRIMALWMVGFVGSRPLAAAMVGSIADVASVPAAFIVTGVLVAVVAVLCRPSALAER
ncbi:MAG: major facilitator superfamily transporter [Aeromicrobium sp.]|nr:major facilitator superfamily transporter [Aeromicrobium sp.]